MKSVALLATVAAVFSLVSASEDGTEEEHKALDTKDSAQIKNLVQWILAQ